MSRAPSPMGLVAATGELYGDVRRCGVNVVDGTVRRVAIASDQTLVAQVVESALRDGGAGSLLFVTDPAEINRLQHPVLRPPPRGRPHRLGSWWPAERGVGAHCASKTVYPI